MGPADEDAAGYGALRRRMVEEQIAARGVRDPGVIRVMAEVPRHLFLGEANRELAYEDCPLPIGHGQMISQPYMVAVMTELLGLSGSERVLEVGTGSGYQAAVLAEIAKEVYTIEIRSALADRAGRTLKDLGYKNVSVKCADGYHGWQEHAPFDAIIITASVNHIPPPLIKQLREGGRLILPLGRTVYYQVLTLATKKKDGLDVVQLGDVVFVPMVGEAQKER